MDYEIVEVSRMIHTKMSSDSPEHLYKSSQVTIGYVYQVLQLLDRLIFPYYRTSKKIKKDAQDIYKRLNIESTSTSDDGETIYEILIIAEQVAYANYLAAVAEAFCEKDEDILSIIQQAKFFTRMYKYRLGLQDQNIPRKFRKHRESIFTFEYKYLDNFNHMSEAFLQQGRPDLVIDALRTLVRLICFYSPHIRRAPESESFGPEQMRLRHRSHWVDQNFGYLLERVIEIVKHPSIADNHDHTLRAMADVIIQDLSMMRAQF